MANTVSYWKRKRFFYYSYIHLNNRMYSGTIVKKLDFFSYHLIKFIHGEQKLRDMALSFDKFDPFDFE